MSQAFTTHERFGLGIVGAIAVVFFTVLSLSCSPKQAYGGEPPAAKQSAPRQTPVFVVWTDEQGNVTDVDFALADKPETCGALTTADFANRDPQWKAKLDKKWTPHLACGIMIPDAMFNDTSESEYHPQPPSSPGWRDPKIQTPT